jgi:hypothetical protein
LDGSFAGLVLPAAVVYAVVGDRKFYIPSAH